MGFIAAHFSRPKFPLAFAKNSGLIPPHTFWAVRWWKNISFDCEGVATLDCHSKIKQKPHGTLKTDSMSFWESQHTLSDRYVKGKAY